MIRQTQGWVATDITPRRQAAYNRERRRAGLSELGARQIAANYNQRDLGNDEVY